MIDPISMKIQTEKCTIPGAVGTLEAVLDLPSQINSKNYVAVCCHPHPQHGGALSNKVTYTASRTLAGLGITSLRFNFRGVGESAGTYGEGDGEQDDLVAAVNWIRVKYPNRPLILAGFSFGARISALQGINLNCALLISIAPPVDRIPFTGFERPKCPWLIIQGLDDELVNSDTVKSWGSEFNPPAVIEEMVGASHFFHGKLTELRSIIEAFTMDSLKLIR